jgi:hypothetical protein
MACVHHPPPVIAAIIAASPAAESRPSFRAVSRRAAPYDAANGDLDFHCLHHAIRIRLTLQTPGVRFAREHPLSFAYHKGDRLRPVTPHVRQFIGGVRRLNATSITFKYRNSRDCGIPHGRPRCRFSEYGLLIADRSGALRHIDPVIGNGGTHY